MKAQVKRLIERVGKGITELSDCGSKMKPVLQRVHAERPSNPSMDDELLKLQKPILSQHIWATKMKQQAEWSLSAFDAKRTFHFPMKRDRARSILPPTKKQALDLSEKFEWVLIDVWL